MRSRLGRAWRELVRKDADAAPATRPHVGPAAGEGLWEWAQRGAIDWQLHVEEGELKLELARRRMRAAVLEADGVDSGERGAE